MKDFRDKNSDIVTMFRGTDKLHRFQYAHPDGSELIWSQYDVVCEGRLAIANEKKDFSFLVSEAIYDGEVYGVITIPKNLITSSIREHKIYYKVFATHKTSGSTIVLNYGEVWLK